MPLLDSPFSEVAAAEAETPERLLARLLEHRTAVFRVCLGFAVHAADAEDLTHDVYERALRHAAELGGPEHARLWLFRVARNLCLDYRRRLRVRQFWAPQLAPDDRDGGDPQHDAERADQIACLKRALRRLPRKQQEVLVLREYGGLGYKEISSLLGLTAGTVMSRLHNARRKLQQLMEDDRENP